MVSNTDRADKNRPRFRLLRREIDSLTREKTIVLALLIQLFIAAFSSFLVVGLVSITSPSAAGTTEVGITGNASTPIIEAADPEDLIIRQYDSQEAAVAAFESGNIDAIINGEWGPDNRLELTITVPEGGFQTTGQVVKFRELAERLEEDLRFERAEYLSTKPVRTPATVENASRFYSFTYTVLLPLLLFLPVFISGSIVVDSLSEEIEEGTLELLRVAPISETAIVDGKYLTAVLIAPVQAIIWIGLLLVNGTVVHHIPALLVLMVGMTMILVAMGIGVTVFFPSRRQGQFAYSLAVIILLVGSNWLPESPANVAARLAIGSAGPEIYINILGILAVGAVLTMLIRRYVATYGIDPQER